MSKASILIATTNHGKLREFQALLSGLRLQLENLDDHPTLPEVVENADTFEGNARLKALHYARLTGRWTLADDSGLEVDALGGRPGVYSSRYAGPGGDAAANNAKLIRELSGVPQERRSARFICVAVLAEPSDVLATAFGRWEGVIVDEPRRHHGFGYDPHFLVPHYGITSAEMSPEQKNRLSHRGQALRAIRAEIERLLASGAPSGAVEDGTPLA